MGLTATSVACRWGTPSEACQADAGRCVYMSLSDGTLCGTGQSSRCCAGTCINIGVNSANCGGCGLACATGQTCQPLERSNCASAEPVNTSGRCTCAAGAACPNSQSCSNAQCKPLSNAQCAPGESIGDGGVCLTYCRY